MNTNDNRSDGLMGLVVASLVGAAIGAGVALLLAPQSGKASRDWLARRSRQLKDRVAGALEQTRDAARNGRIPS